MDFHISLFVAFMLIAACSAQDPLTATFNKTGPIHVRDGAENIVLLCTINRDALYIINNKAHIIHKNAVTQEEVVMSASGQLTSAASPSFYAVKVLQVEGNFNEMHLRFTIRKVRPQDDGTYICKITGSNEEASGSVDVVLVRNFDALYLQFGDLEPVSQTLADPIEIDSGTYTVSCIANGSNPSTEDVHLRLDGEKVTTGAAVVTQMSDTVQRQYSTRISADVAVNLKNSGQTFECSAKSPGEGGNQLAVGLSFKVNIYEPDVTCNDTSAYEGKMYPVLSCLVNHSDITVASYKFQFGEDGEIIAEGTTNSDSASVMSTAITDVLSKVELKLYKAQSHHFNQHYYLLIEGTDGHVTKSRIVLVKEKAPVTTAAPRQNQGAATDPNGPNDPDVASSTMMSLASMFFSVLCSLVLRQF